MASLPGPLTIRKWRNATMARTVWSAGWLLVALVVLGTAVPVHGQGREGGREAPRPEVRGGVEGVDAGAGTLTLTIGEGRGPTTEKTFSLAKDAEVAVGSTFGRGGLYKPGKLGDLAAGVLVSLTLTADQKSVDTIVAEGPMVRGQLTAVDT